MIPENPDKRKGWFSRKFTQVLYKQIAQIIAINLADVSDFPAQTADHQHHSVCRSQSADFRTVVSAIEMAGGGIHAFFIRHAEAAGCPRCSIEAGCSAFAAEAPRALAGWCRQRCAAWWALSSAAASALNRWI